MKNKRFLAQLLGISIMASTIFSSINVTVLLASTSLSNVTVENNNQVDNESSTLSESKLVISATGGKMETAGDSFQYSYLPVTGDFTATFKVAELKNTSSNSRVYLMVRNGLDATSPHLSAGIKGSSSGSYELRLPDRNSGSLSGAGLNQYIRIEKIGTTYKLYTSSSTDFSSVKAIKTYDTTTKNNTSELGNASVNVGIAVCDATATIDYFNVVDQSGNTIYNLNNDQGGGEIEATITSVAAPNAVTVYQGDTVSLPATVEATYSDGSKAQVNVTWDSVNTSTVGTKTVKGTIANFATGTSINVTVLEKAPVVTGSTIYVSPTGSDNGLGTTSSPMSISKAITSIQQGGTIYLTGGTYKLNKQLTIAETNSGTASKMNNLVALNGAEVILDFSAQAYGEPSTNERGIQLDGSYWYIKGITVQGAADNGFFVSGKNNKLELCVARANRDTGIQISRRNSSLSSMKDWPANNLILNCTSYNNSDPATGENADGFAAKLTCGEGNVFDGCIAYNNVDDGWDLYAKTETGPIGSVTIKNCIAFRNGATTDGHFTANSDGNGFKLGGSGIAVPHRIENSIAFENKNHGFTDNSNPGTITLKNCTSINNSLDNGGKSNFDFARDKSKSNNVLINCISFSEGKVASDKYIGKAENCVFYGGGKWYEFTTLASANSTLSDLRGTQITGPTASDFATLTAPAIGTDFHTLWRNSDGSINMGNVFKIASNSTFANRNLGANLSK
ncbi:Ig-like domain-containing protein [Cellulosilyticum lentocellum]|uniref:Pectate disaccharide-lyase n=1 Tax=Cellulosilyticum lentocellum (strain ATCC 49066 / DSM 5427 / NCIMB 11756 / RHM5) TaxID=642492 RepID=F2JIV6_CELLD|nr:Ig-like domain-containing protein [Cellulosilyticum lentocellum]ADZ82028.1 Pectate disaccharide-lyase [Cellulosilyticum lentocellum DSM 5427]